MVNWRGIFLITIVAGMFLLLVGCSEKQCGMPAGLANDLFVTVESDKTLVKVNEPIRITAQVKFGIKDISKNTNVKFEFLENGRSMGSITPEYEGDGNYSIETIFSTTGQNEVIAHVEYKDFHEMPKLEINVIE